ncbi:MAG: DNA polymerase III subunit gamma/tau [Clostridia bacterium]|nr:DNA polymerase III subunit gamma/tau [Clostridia bacterium]
MEQHLALYRKWRPLTFEDVFGQDHVTAALRNQVSAGRTSHAYLFTGTRGTGKTTCAKILARAVCCEHPVNGSPCNTCAACRSILEDAALDVSEIDAASNNGVDNIRDIREEAAFSPTALKKRVYIIDEVHMLSAGAFNALLKTLEEPPEHVLFILATTEIHKVPATILSRCQRYDFRRIPPEIIAARLNQIAAEEGFALSSPAAALLARLGDGSMRDAISLLDRSVSADGNIDLERVTEALGVPSADTVVQVYQAIIAGDGSRALELFTDCYLEGRDIVSLFDQLLSLLRDLYVLKATGRQEYLMSSSAADPKLLQSLANQADGATLEYFVSCVSDLLTRLTRTAIKRTDGEMCLLKMCLRHQSMDAKPVQLSAPAPVAVPAAAPAAPAAKTAAPAPAWDNDAPPPFSDADLPPWESDAPVEQYVPQPAPEVAPARREAPAAPVRTAAPAAPVRSAAPASAGDEAVKEQFLTVAQSKVSGAVRTYLKLADMQAVDGVLHIACREESMIFMKKPAVQEVLNEAAAACGYRSAAIRKMGDPIPGGGKASAPAAEPAKPADPMADILARARALGVEVK